MHEINHRFYLSLICCLYPFSAVICSNYYCCCVRCVAAAKPHEHNSFPHDQINHRQQIYGIYWFSDEFFFCVWIICCTLYSALGVCVYLPICTVQGRAAALSPLLWCRRVLLTQDSQDVSIHTCTCVFAFAINNPGVHTHPRARAGTRTKYTI